MKILVRERELACRNTWGEDLWVDASSPATTSSEQGQPRRSFTYLNSNLDDEVTSVVDTSARSATPTVTDDVVTMTSMLADDAVVSQRSNDVNSLAVADQEERARVMARGSRDAILSARQRHVQRWSTRQASPAAADDDGATQADAVTSFDPEMAADVPPVASNADNATAEPSPAAAIHLTDVASNVGLPRLRNFLKGSDPLPAPAPDARPRSHFDHVIRQAERIRGQTDTNRPAPSPVPAITTAPEPVVSPTATSAGSTSNEPADVVWDVDPKSLDVAFARARAAIEQPHHHSAPPEPTPASDSPEDPELSMPQPVIAADVGEADDWFPELEPDFTGELAHDADHDDVFLDDDDQPDALTVDAQEDDWLDDSPRSSWWRSLNFGLRRRFQGRPRVDDPDDDWADHVEDEDWGYRDADADVHPEPPALEEDVSSQWDDDQWEPPMEEPIAASASTWQPPAVDSWSDDEPWESHDDPSDRWVESGDDQELAASEMESTRHVTSQESWVLDEREFPAPAPPEWHPIREAMLASLPPIESLDDSVEWIAPTPQAPRAEPLPVRRPLPERRAFMDIDAPAGMDAFRAALFNQSEAPASESADNYALRAEPESWLPYSPEPSRPTREVFDFDSEASRMETGSRIEWQPEADPRRMSAERQRFRETMRQEVETSYEEPTPPATRFDAPVRSYQDDPPSLPLGSSDGALDKRCLTCRSYSPSEDRSRGWCTNEWSSAHRSMVNADELACRSSMGDWWIAADTTWIPPEDIIRPTTPRTAQMLDEMDDNEELEFDRPQRLHVRTRNVG